MAPSFLDFVLFIPLQTTPKLSGFKSQHYPFTYFAAIWVLLGEMVDLHSPWHLLGLEFHCCVWSLIWMSETSGAWLSITFFSVQPLYRTSLASSLHGGLMAVCLLTYLLAFFSECESRGSQAFLVPELGNPRMLLLLHCFYQKGKP